MVVVILGQKKHCFSRTAIFRRTAFRFDMDSVFQLPPTVETALAAGICESPPQRPPGRCEPVYHTMLPAAHGTPLAPIGHSFLGGSLANYCPPNLGGSRSAPSTPVQSARPACTPRTTMVTSTPISKDPVYIPPPKQYIASSTPISDIMRELADHDPTFELPSSAACNLFPRARPATAKPWTPLVSAHDDDIVNSADYSIASQRFLTSPEYDPYPESDDGLEPLVIHQNDEEQAITEKLMRLVKAAYKQTQSLVADNKENPSRREQLAVFQYIILHWTVLLGHPSESLKHFTLHDFINKDDVPQCVRFRIRRNLNKPDGGYHVVTVTEWMYGTLVYYFSTIRNLWVANATPKAINLPFSNYTEWTTHFLLNSRGMSDINFSKAVARYQKKKGTAEKEHIQRAHVQSHPAVTAHLEQIMASHHLPQPCEFPTIEDIFPQTRRIHSGTKLPTESAIRKKLQDTP
jgi:hypothetical protein